MQQGTEGEEIVREVLDGLQPPRLNVVGTATEGPTPITDGDGCRTLDSLNLFVRGLEVLNDGGGVAGVGVKALGGRGALALILVDIPVQLRAPVVTTVRNIDHGGLKLTTSAARPLGVSDTVVAIKSGLRAVHLAAADGGGRQKKNKEWSVHTNYQITIMRNCKYYVDSPDIRLPRKLRWARDSRLKVGGL